VALPACPCARRRPAPRRPHARRLAAAVLLGLLLAACRSGTPAGPATPGTPPAVAVPPAPFSAEQLAALARLDAERDTRRAAPAAPPLPTAGVAAAPPAARVALLWATDDAPAALDRPAALALDRRGDLFVVEAGRARITVFDRDGRFERAWGGPGADAGQFRFLVSGCPGGYHPEACMPEVGGGVAVDDRERVYVADFGNHRVQVFDRDGRPLAAWGRLGDGPGEFRLPAGIAADGRGRVYVGDGGNARVQVFDRDGHFLAAWGGPGTGDGRFRRPGALAVDGRGRLAVVDRRDDRVQLFDPDGRFLAAWPAPSGSPLGAGGGPAGLAFDADGGLVVAGIDAEVRQVDEVGRSVRSWRADWRGQGRLARPAGVAVDGDGDVYVADAGGGRVVKFRVLTPVTG
jgi:DNA-binding beta-propeller fold protein YncE